MLILMQCNLFTICFNNSIPLFFLFFFFQAQLRFLRKAGILSLDGWMSASWVCGFPPFFFLLFSIYSPPLSLSICLRYPAELLVIIICLSGCVAVCVRSLISLWFPICLTGGNLIGNASIRFSTFDFSSVLFIVSHVLFLSPAHTPKNVLLLL